MEKRLQQRLIGAAVIIALAVIFLPMLLNGGGNGRVSMKMKIPPEPSYSFNGAAQPPAASGTAPVQPISVAPAAGAESQQSAPAPTQQKPAATAQQSTAPAPTPQPAPKMVEPKVTAPSVPVQQKPAPKPKPPAQPAKPQPAPAQNEASTGGKLVTPSWVVQVSSLSKESGANALRDRLRKQGFAAYVDRFDDKSRGKVYYRVRVGPKLTRAGAEAQQAKILKATKLKGIVVPYK